VYLHTAIMHVYQQFKALQQAAVQKPAAKLKKRDFCCVGSRGFPCASPHLPHKGLGMCRNCHQSSWYESKQSAALANAEQVTPPDQATLRRWYAECGNNASKAAKKYLPIAGTLATFTKRILRAVKNAS
jgi:hypothetical protein